MCVVTAFLVGSAHHTASTRRSRCRRCREADNLLTQMAIQQVETVVVHGNTGNCRLAVVPVKIRQHIFFIKLYLYSFFFKLFLAVIVLKEHKITKSTQQLWSTTHMHKCQQNDFSVDCHTLLRRDYCSFPQQSLQFPIFNNHLYQKSIFEGHN